MADQTITRKHLDIEMDVPAPVQAPMVPRDPAGRRGS